MSTAAACTRPVRSAACPITGPHRRADRRRGGVERAAHRLAHRQPPQPVAVPPRRQRQRGVGRAELTLPGALQATGPPSPGRTAWPAARRGRSPPGSGAIPPHPPRAACFGGQRLLLPQRAQVKVILQQLPLTSRPRSPTVPPARRGQPGRPRTARSPTRDVNRSAEGRRGQLARAWDTVSIRALLSCPVRIWFAPSNLGRRARPPRVGGSDASCARGGQCEQPGPVLGQPAPLRQPLQLRPQRPPPSPCQCSARPRRRSPPPAAAARHRPATSSRSR